MANPVVVIPGYYGSKLADAVTRRLIWLDGQGLANPDRTLEALRLDVGDPDRVIPVGILDEVAILPPFIDPDVYKGLARFLRENLHRQHVFEFFYDWRKSIEEGADLLDRQITRWLNETGASKVDIVAHSQGGLIARAYLQKHQAQSNVDWLITLGCPHKGMLKTFRAVVQGLRVFTFPAAKVRQISRFLPSTYDLLPNDAANGLFRANGANANPLQTTGWCPPNQLSLLNAANSRIRNLLPPQLPVKTCIIYGTRLATTTSATFANGQTSFSDDTHGDGTVPEVSARGQGLTGTDTVLRFAIPFGLHSRLFGLEKVQQKILTTVLLGREVAQAQLFSGFSSEPFFIPRERNLFVAAVQQKDGTPITNATVQLTIDGTSVNRQVIPSVGGGEYAATIVMPGAGMARRYTVTATVPGMNDPEPDKGLLVSTRS